MSGREEKVEKVDIENVEHNELFEKVYGKEVAEKARKTLDDLKINNSGLEVDTNARLSVFNREKVYEADWTESTLNLLESMMKKCSDNAKAYAAAARDARSKHRFSSIPLIFIGTVATAVSFFSAGDVCDPDDNEDGLKYLLAVLTGSLTIGSGLMSLYSFQGKMDACINAAGNFENLARRARIQIFLPNKLRAHSELVLSEISADLAHLTTTSPLL